MKTKKFLGILVSMFLLFSAQGFCQSTLVATLSRGDTLVSVHYGIEALKVAYDDAQDGDLITLSSGSFKAVDISKNITIRGAGMVVDTLNNCLPTILKGSFEIQIKQGNVNSLHIEGIYHNENIYVSHTSAHASFLKCRLNKLTYKNISDKYANHYYFKDAQFVNCKILTFNISGSASFYNCYVSTITNSESQYAQELSFYNSVIYDDVSDLKDCIFNNSIIISSYKFYASNYVANCIGIYTSKDVNAGNMFSSIPGVFLSSSKFFRSIGEVFDTNTFDGGNYSDSDTYQLQDSIRTKYLSHDETEIGLYGGVYPYDPITYAPKIKKFKVARTSNANGQLEVEINVVPGATIKND